MGKMALLLLNETNSTRNSTGLKLTNRTNGTALKQSNSSNGTRRGLRFVKTPFVGFAHGQSSPVVGELKTEYDDNCLDYNYNDGNVYMHPCHGGSNQAWHINPDGTMGTSYD